MFVSQSNLRNAAFELSGETIYVDASCTYISNYPKFVAESNGAATCKGEHISRSQLVGGISLYITKSKVDIYTI
jgi:hypothetical protein